MVPCRLVIWSAVGAALTLNSCPARVVDFADRCVAASAFTGELEHLRGMSVSLIELLTGPERTGSLPPSPPGERRGEVAVGYLGTVDPLKMHPEFTALSLAVEHPGARFIVRGTGDGLAGLRREAEAAGAPERFDIAGYVPDPAALFAEFDIFGYPLCADNYSSLKLVLQEAMFAGVPPVVLPYGAWRGPSPTASPGSWPPTRPGTRRPSGTSAPTRSCAPASARRLAATPRRAGRRRSAAPPGTASIQNCSSCPSARAAGPSRPPRPARRPSSPRSARPPTCSRRALPAIRRPMRRSPRARRVLGWADGGVLDYRRRYPADSHLHLWAGLVLAARGRRALAAGEFAAAKRAGLDPERVEGSLAELVGVAGSMTSAGATRGLLVASAPPAPGRARPIAYLGSSVTVQRREGYQPRLHAALCSALGRAHRPVRAAVGGTGSITGLYMLDDLVLYHAPELCVIEFVPTDAVGATPPAVLEAVLEALAPIRLRTHECEPCFLLLGRRDSAPMLDATVAAYHAVAADQEVACIDSTTLFDGDDSAFLDAVHTTALGADRIAAEAAGAIATLALRPPAQPSRSPSFADARLRAPEAQERRGAGPAHTGVLGELFPYLVTGRGNGSRRVSTASLMGSWSRSDRTPARSRSAAAARPSATCCGVSVVPLRASDDGDLGAPARRRRRARGRGAGGRDRLLALEGAARRAPGR